MADPLTKRQRSFRVDAVILRHSDWGEADRLLTLYTAEMGKVKAIAKGARKPRSRKAGHLEPFTHAALLLARGRDIMLVTQAETINAFLTLRSDLLLSTYAAYVIELVDRFTYEGDTLESEDRLIFRLVVDALDWLNERFDPDLVTRFYELHLLNLVGFRPQLFNCASCNTRILPQDQFFSVEAGGVVCPKCGASTPGVRPITMQGLKYLRHFQRSSFAEARRAQVPPITAREIESLMQSYVTYLLERSLNSPAFLRRIRKERLENPL